MRYTVSCLGVTISFVVALSIGATSTVPVIADQHDCAFEKVDGIDTANTNFECVAEKIEALTAENAKLSTQIGKLVEAIKLLPKTAVSKGDMDAATRNLITQKQFDERKMVVDDTLFDRVDAIPTGAVVAFTSSCPKVGWAEYGPAFGRVILGANPDSRNRLSQRDLNSTGGQERVTLSPEQMPKHSHNLQDFVKMTNAAWRRPSVGVAYMGSTPIDKDGDDIHRFIGEVSEAGNSQPHDNMPPFIALFYCKKI